MTATNPRPFAISTRVLLSEELATAEDATIHVLPAALHERFADAVQRSRGWRHPS